MGSLKGTAQRTLARVGLLDVARRTAHRVRSYRQPRRAVDHFELNQRLISSIFPAPASIAVASISAPLLRSIESAVSDGTIERCSLLELDDRNSSHLLLEVDQHTESVQAVLASNLTVLALHRLDASHPLLAALHDEIRTMFSSSIGSPFVIVNSRMWISKPGGEAQGPNSFHTDGFAPGHLKVMVYVSPLTEEDGYFEYLDQGSIKRLVGYPAGTAVLFRNSEIVHRRVAGTCRERISIELTLMRSSAWQEQSWPGHFFGRHLCEPTISYQEERGSEHGNLEVDRYYFRNENSGLKVNIGSGRRNWDGWVCFDELVHEGVSSLKLDPSVTLPLEDESTSLAYSSHCLEHLDSATVNRLMSEIHRITSVGAPLVLKIPDYDFFQFLGRSGMTISTLMDGKGIESVTDSWADRIDDTFMNRVAMMFCGYWNEAHGEHFLGTESRMPGSYHGPPMIDDKQLREIFSEHEPSRIAGILCDHALSDPEFARFNHQSAWSRAEMKQLLSAHGFKVISTSTDVICQRFRRVIPDIADMQAWSSYFLATRQ